MLSKKQKLINKKLRHKKSKAFLDKQERKEYKKKLREWALKIRERDKVCLVCKSDQHLNAHHLISKSIKELALDEDNGVLLCAKHHRFDRWFSPHKGPFLFHTSFFFEKKEQTVRLLEKANSVRK